MHAFNVYILPCCLPCGGWLLFPENFQSPSCLKLSVLSIFRRRIPSLIAVKLLGFNEQLHNCKWSLTKVITNYRRNKR
jgi:hypothetical protein